VAALSELAPRVKRDWQTIVSHGISQSDWAAFLGSGLPAGIDRIVKPGEALDFDALWDGVDLLAAMTRIVALGV
jgi:hypothetical protein